MNKKVYFAGSIRGGRVDATLYQKIINYLNSATVSINRLLDSKLSLWCLEASFECCISRDKPFHPLTPPSDLRQYAVENRQEI